MGPRLNLSYDREGDILYVNAIEPYAEQHSAMIADGVVGRMNPDSGAVENLEILSFSKRFNDLGDSIDLPVSIGMTPPLAS
jgi:hypothetical protein